MKISYGSLSLVAVLSVFILAGCSKAEPTAVCQLTLSEHAVVFDAQGGTGMIDVIPFPETGKGIWTAAYQCEQEWFTFETDESGLKVTAVPNYSTSVRSGAIILTSPEAKFEPYTVSVYQESSSPLELVVSADDHAFDSEGGVYTFSVQSNYQWTVSADAEWLSVSVDDEQVTVSADANTSEESYTGSVTVRAGLGELSEEVSIDFTQGTRADNPYFKLIGQWEISAAKWYYSPNGSLNSLDYNPSPTDYFLIFDLEEAEYGKSYLMKDFLYPDTSLEVAYDRETGNIVIPFGWTVYSYDVFLYITLVGSSSFSYASLEVDGVPSEDFTTISLQLPSVDGFNYVGFGLWTYDDDGDKVALGSRSYPTMFPMGPIVFKKHML